MADRSCERVARCREKRKKMTSCNRTRFLQTTIFPYHHSGLMHFLTSQAVLDSGLNSHP
ncbi:hypothetical protein PVAP13_2KG059816 [Panicum virgatum]|uniref:Uncharacterized protein n=1 Tax=Panicum virgatum TaxID=38727 RepID=A0A8T0W6F2_PANVG|nr:hypothetical protein PVAP13_2KG059816 [Panicum virgatum]